MSEISSLVFFRFRVSFIYDLFWLVSKTFTDLKHVALTVSQSCQSILFLYFV